MMEMLTILLTVGAPAEQTSPPIAPILEIVPQPDSVIGQKQVTKEREAALKKVARSRRDVTRSFLVGWERHHGLFLVPASAHNILAAKWFAPDFNSLRLRDHLATEAAGYSDMSVHVGSKLICQCAGIAWSFHGEKRFLIRQAQLILKRNTPH